MRRLLSIFTATVILFCTLPAGRAGASGNVPEGALPSGTSPVQNVASDANPQEIFSSGMLSLQDVPSDAQIQEAVFSDAALPAESGTDSSGATDAPVGISFSSYRGTGMFQAGSLAGPQSLPTQAAPFHLRASRTADPETTLYNDIVLAMHNEVPQSISIGGNTRFAIRVDVPAGAYPLPADDKKTATASMDAVYYVYARAVNDHPDFFYFIPDVEFAATVGSDAHIVGLYMRVNEAAYGQKGTYAAEKAAMRDDVFPQGTEGLSKTEIALALHDYLALHLRYHSAAANASLYDGVYEQYPGAFSAYGAVVDKQAVCHGLSLALKSLLADFGIESWIVADYTIGHAWNLLRLEDGCAYHADLTHALGGAFAPEGQVLHDRFLLSDTEVESVLSTSAGNWLDNLPEAAQQHPQRAFWAGISAAMYPMAGQWYFMDGNGGKGNLQTSGFGAKRTAKTLYSNIGGLSRIGDKLYFYDYNDNGIYAYSPTLHLRTLRVRLENGFDGSLRTGAVQKCSALAADEIHYALSNGNPRSFYAGDALGDPDGNGVCDVRDVLHVLRAIDGATFVAAGKVPLADVIWDSCIDENDARRIAEMAVGLAV